MKRYLAAVGAAFAMLILILDAKTALAGAIEGVNLCIQVLIPSLFPFLVLSAIVTSSLLGTGLPILKPVGSLCGIPKGGESLLAAGLLGGYPVGAKNVTDAYKSGGLHRQDAQRMLGFCNQAGPAFIFGLLGQQFDRISTVWLLWGIHIVSALAVGALTRKDASTRCIQNSASTQQVMVNSLKAMATICGWVILFRILTVFLERWFLWRFPTAIRVLLTGLLELTCGCVQLSQLEHPGIRFLIASVLLSLGGCCVLLQTASVSAPLGIKDFIKGKLLQCALSVIVSCVILQMRYGFQYAYLWLILPSICLVLLAKRKNSSRKNAAVHV